MLGFLRDERRVARLEIGVAGEVVKPHVGTLRGRDAFYQVSSHDVPGWRVGPVPRQLYTPATLPVAPPPSRLLQFIQQAQLYLVYATNR
jgi:hypothetical protein